ncbi:hypothetical protein HHL08_12385 [Sphingobium sp. AR-3-1]|uniref:LPXTG cell wall anchor domain-containing protein n=1 Tax=Sphingobium psychrophilum TaxID=2728834 RepID=A0A7X9ZTU7_9SPHN|nr:hypothetical protein [Sphingobium psychrophilum]NML10931.1 hypothetical protein [Sphingobium psychrophilum]
MGYPIRPLSFAAPLLAPMLAIAALSAVPVHAQQAQETTPGFQLPPANSTPAPNTNRQGPELNVYRDPVTPSATQPVTPPVIAPTVTRPPATVQPTPQPSRPRPAPSATPAETPRSPRRTDRATPPPAQPARAPETAPAATTPTQPATNDAPANASAPVAPTPQPLPAPAANAVENPEPAAPTAPTTEDASPLSWPWIVGGALALAVLAAAFLLRRRRLTATPLAEPASEPAPVATPKASAAPAAPADTVRVTPAAPATARTPAPQASDRPWLAMDLIVSQARYSLMGVTISYSLILHNRGDRPARDVLVRGLLGTGGAQQQALLNGFFTGEDGLPLHSAVSIASGETLQLAGELRLPPDQIVPVTMGQRSLLIPLAAFDAAYRWGPDEDEATAQGRTARAFIVGQEQEPPAQRLAPLRLDQGPRQYRRPAARAAAELTPA